MSITIESLGLTDSIRDIILEVRSSTLYVIERIDVESNEFLPEDAEYEVLITAPAIGVKQLSAEEVREYFGTVEAAFVRCTIATPPAPFQVAVGLYALLDYSDGTKVYKGKIERVEPTLSSLINVYINTKELVEFDTLTLGILV